MASPQPRYEYGLTPEEQSQSIWPLLAAGINPFTPIRREVLQEPEIQHIPVDGSYVRDYTSGEYGEREWGFRHMPSQRLWESGVGGLWDLLTNPEVRKSAWTKIKGYPEAAARALEEYKQNQLRDYRGYDYLYDPETDKEHRPDPLLALYGVSGGLAALVAGPKSGPFLGTFGGRLGARRADRLKGLEQATALKEKGKLDLAELWKKKNIGWMGESGKEFPVFEIQDYMGRIPQAIAQSLITPERAHQELVGETFPLQEIIKNPELYSIYSSPSKMPALVAELENIKSDISLYEQKYGLHPTMFYGRQNPMMNQQGVNKVMDTAVGVPESVPIPILQNYVELIRKQSTYEDVLNSAEGSFKPLGESPVTFKTMEPPEGGFLKEYVTSGSYHSPIPGKWGEQIEIYLPEKEGVLKSRPGMFSSNLESILGHETQHPIQLREGWPEGTSSERVLENVKWERLNNPGSQLVKMFDERYDIVRKGLETEWTKEFKEGLSPSERVAFENQRDKMAIDQVAFELYESDWGEMMARTVQHRLHMGREMRQSLPPYHYQSATGESVPELAPGSKFKWSGVADPRKGIDFRPFTTPDAVEHFDWQDWALKVAQKAKSLRPSRFPFLGKK
jgi:hypothetical protein